MQKLIRIMAIVAAVLVGVSLLLLLVTIPFQRILGDAIFGVPPEVMGRLPVIPVVPALDCMAVGVCVGLLIICCGNKKGGIWLEILVLIVLIFLLPAARQGVSLLQNVVLGRFFGYEQLSAAATMSRLFALCEMPAGLGIKLAYIASGMSIAFKHMSKKIERIQKEEIL